MHLNDDKHQVLRSLLASPFYDQIWKNLSDTTKNSVIGEFFEAFDAKFSKESKQMVSFEAAIAIATKQ